MARTKLISILGVAALVAAQVVDRTVLLQSPPDACSTPAVLDARTNIWKEYTLHTDPYYRIKVEKAVEAIQDVELRDKASKVADVGTFMTTVDDIQDLADIANTVPCTDIIGLVLDNLPYKGQAPEGLAFNQTIVQYQASYIDSIVETIRSSSNTSFAVIVEPRAFLAYFNDTTNIDLAKSYRENIPYALKALNLPNVITYLDVGNSNSMDWDRQRNVAAKEIIDIYQAAGSPSQFRGFATNVANFNSWDLLPGEFVPADDSRYTRPQNEQQFIRILSDALNKNRMLPQAVHAIMDTSRNGVSGLRESWDDWCNVNGAGFGIRPTAQTGDERLDAFLWVKQPGESDGTSDPTGPGYDSSCGKEDALKHAPTGGSWYQAYFEMLIHNSNLSLRM
ncbi:glycoside hydrolase family 6 protein [Hypoxylon trugodes]|uniref:glycoside hydrolase family 6 protein n=1 Tax=Hypoxylon trugodes TaxID=326681 RepID=UPI0021992777|nr:glycoside hydrolase family 6 protein [Hypoxylon trugodes]KAI1383931.1 glycoside hydrolase family 6 protein [Hypoxylon trugodes]